MGDSTDHLTPRQIAIGTIVLIVGAIGIGMAAPLVTESLVRFFPAQVEQYVDGHKSHAGWE